MMFDFEAIDAAQSRQEASDQVRMWIQSWFAVQSAGHEELHGKQVDDTGEYDTYDHGGFKTYGLPSLNLSIPHVDIAELEQNIDRCENHAYRHGLKGQRHVSKRPLPGWHVSSARCEKEGFGRSVKYHMRERKAQIRQDRLQSRAARITAFINPKHAVRAHGAARRKALSPSWARRRSFSDKEANDDMMMTLICTVMLDQTLVILVNIMSMNIWRDNWKVNLSMILNWNVMGYV
jgi:hypothetical protein